MSDDKRMNISDEAVEAAARRIAGHYGAGANNWEWYLTEASEVLVAASPHLMESAFVRGYRSALADRSQDRNRRTPKWSRKHRAAGAEE
jgi:hypothetical protein